MSERIYAWLLRFYPDGFRNEFGEEARLLIRDRLRNETGFRSRLRFWFDVIADFVRSLAHEHSLPEFQTAGVSLLYDFGDQSPRGGPLCVGAMLTLILLFTFPLLIEVGVNPRPDFRTASASTPGGFSGLRSLWSFWFQGLGAKSRPEFEVASIKPTSEKGDDVNGSGQVVALPGGRLSADRAQLRYIIQVAYGVRDFQLLEGPDWISSAHYNIDAKAESSVSPQQTLLMLQALLEDRFKLKVHRETRDLPVYELSIAKGGPKIPSSKEGSCTELPPPTPKSLPPILQPGVLLCGRVVGQGAGPDGTWSELSGGGVTMASLIRTLTSFLKRLIIDKTGLQGTFDIRIEFDGRLAGAADDGVTPRGPSLFTAIQEQLGLRLDSTKGPVDVIVIDSVERPAPNGHDN